MQKFFRAARNTEIRGEFLSSRNTKSPFPAAEAFQLAPRLCTPKEAGQLLEYLRSAYQSLAPEGQCEAKTFMFELAELQRRFGSSIRNRTVRLGDNAARGA